MKKAFSEVIFSKKEESLSSISGTIKDSRKIVKRAFSLESTKRAIAICNHVIKNPQTRKQTVTFIKAANGKKIRNTSGV